MWGDFAESVCVVKLQDSGCVSILQALASSQPQAMWKTHRSSVNGMRMAGSIVSEERQVWPYLKAAHTRTQCCIYFDYLNLYNQY